MTREGLSDWNTHPWVAEAEHRVRFGVDLGPPPTFAASLEWARMVEQLGFDSFWLRDHPARAPEDPFTFLAAVAGVTHRVRLGTLVACAQYRHPLLLARVAPGGRRNCAAAGRARRAGGPVGLTQVEAGLGLAQSWRSVHVIQSSCPSRSGTACPAGPPWL